MYPIHPIITNPSFSNVILEATSASSLVVEEVIQDLWSGYGQILRLRLTGGIQETVVVKFINLPKSSMHPRGWNTDLSHQRKLRSYEVESHWYQYYNDQCKRSRTPKMLAVHQTNEEMMILLEDLDSSGYPNRLTTISLEQIKLCLQWLAEFHATFLQENLSAPTGLWKTGTYWHLETRPDELAALDDETLKAVASDIDLALSNAHYQTLVHGDAKLANFCFSEKGDQVAAVDFQYVGGGCGMKDVAYFLGSCLDGDSIATKENEYLDTYFHFLTKALKRESNFIAPEDVVNEWRSLYLIACADFYRFLKGWSPTHWKLNSHSDKIVRGVISLFS